MSEFKSKKKRYRFIYSSTISYPFTDTYFRLQEYVTYDIVEKRLLKINVQKISKYTILI